MPVIIKDTFPVQQMTLPRLTIDGIYNEIKYINLICIKVYSVFIWYSLFSKM